MRKCKECTHLKFNVLNNIYFWKCYMQPTRIAVKIKDLEDYCPFGSDTK